jgi:hypothetical protein
MTRGPALAIVLVSAAVVAGSARLGACTAFCAVAGGRVLVGNNEDSTNPHTRLWFVPAEEGTYGRMYVGYDDLFPQGGMNERGLWFDGFAAPRLEAGDDPKRPEYSGNLIDKAMAECATVADVVAMFERYDRAFLETAIVMFADASGDAVSIERRAIVRKTGPRFVQTNFHQSGATATGAGERFATATAMLERAGDAISVDGLARILEATRQTGQVSTMYSNVYDLSARTMYLYQLHESSRPLRLALDEELKHGARVLEIPALFAAELAHPDAQRRWPSRGVAEFGGVVAAVGVLGAGWALARRRRRRGRS